MCRGFWGKVWKGARDGAKSIASGAKDAACALGTAFDHTRDQAGVGVLACSVAKGGAKCACSILGLGFRVWGLGFRV